MARFNENYGSQTPGVGVPLGHSERFDTANVTYEIVTDGTSKGGQHLLVTKSGSGRPLLGYDVGDGNNQSVLALVEANSNNQLPGLYFNASGGVGDYEGYLIELVYSSNQIGLWRGDGGGAFTPLQTGVSVTLNSGTKYWVRAVRFSNGDIRARVWEDGTTEPTTWQITTPTDSDWTGGWAGVSDLHSSGSTKFHYLSIGTEWDQGCEYEDEEFPDRAVYVQTGEGDDVRIWDYEANKQVVVALFNDHNEVQDVKWHRTKEKIYVVCSSSSSQGAIFRLDRYGANREILRTTLTNCFGITFDYANSLMYYTERQGISGSLYKNSDDGGSEVEIVADSINWPGHPFYDVHTGFIFVPYDNAVQSYNSDGVLQTTYPGINQPHTVVVTEWLVMVGSWLNFGLWHTPVDNHSGGWTNADSTYQVWNLDLTEDQKEIYAAIYNNDRIVKWTNVNPPSSANRIDLDNGTGYNQVHGVGYKELKNEIQRDYIDDPNVHKVTVTAQAVHLAGTGEKRATGWLIDENDLPAGLIDTNDARSEAAGGPTIRVAGSSSGADQLALDIKDFTPAAGGVGGGATATFWVSPGTYTGGADREVTIFWITGGSQTQPAANETYGAELVWYDHRNSFNANTDPTGLAGDVPDSAGRDDGSSAGSMAALVAGPGKIKNAWPYNGTSNEITFGTRDINQAFTVEFWADAPSIGSRRAIIGKHNGGGTNQFVLLFWETNLLTSISNGDIDIGPGATNSGAAHWVVAVEPTQVRWYKDGVLFATHTKSSTIGDVSGGNEWRWGQEWDGGSPSDWWLGNFAAKRILDYVDSDVADVALTKYNNQNEAGFWVTGTVLDGPFSTAPEVNTFVPDEATIGTSIVIGGTGFTGATDVQFAGVSAVTFVVDNDSQITATVPNGAVTGTVSVTTPSGTGVSSQNFVVLPALPPDGWQIELFQIQENVGQTDIEQVTSTYRQYFTEGFLNTNIDFIPISISNAEQSIEWDEGVYRLGSIDVTVQLLEDTYFNNYTNYVVSPFVMVIRDSNGNVIFHGPVDPETAKYNAKNRATAFRVLSWEVLLEAINAPCRSIYETQFSRNYGDAPAPFLNSALYVKQMLNGVDLSTVATVGAVLVFDTPAGEFRSVITGNFVDGDDLGIIIATEPTAYLLSNQVIAAGAHSVFQVGSGGLTWRRLEITYSDTAFFSLLEQVTEGTELLLSVDVNGRNYTMPLYPEANLDTLYAWFTLDPEDRQTVKIYFNICSGSCQPPELETDFLTMGSTLTVTSSTSAQAGDSVRILGKDMYGYDGSTFAEAADHYRINGGVIQGMFALPELGILPYVVDTFTFPANFDVRLERWAELPPNLLESLRQIQNTFGTFLKVIPTVSGGLPRATIEVQGREAANTTDTVVISNITDILEWGESAADLTPTAVVVEVDTLYFRPKDGIDNVGFYYEGVDLADPAVTGKPKNGRVVTIKVNTSPSYVGDVFFGDGTGVRNDVKLKLIAQKFYEYYNAVRRPCEFKFDGTPQEDLLGKMIEISIVDDPLTGSMFERTLFVTSVIVDSNANQTTIQGRIGEFTGISGQTPTAVISGQLVWSDVDGSGDEDIVLSGLSSFDPQGQTLTYSWLRDTVPVATGPLYQETLTPGDYDIQLVVTDPDLNTDSITVLLKVLDQPEPSEDGENIQARFINATWNFNEDGDLLITVEGDEYTQTTNGIKIRTADTQILLDSASDTAYDNPQLNLEIVSQLGTNATKWVRVTLVNDVDGSDSANVWEFAVTNTASTTALIIPAGLTTPSSTADVTGVDGEIRATATHVYVKIAGTGWVRAALSTF